MVASSCQKWAFVCWLRGQQIDFEDMQTGEEIMDTTELTAPANLEPILNAMVRTP